LCGASRHAVGIPMARSCNLEERIVALLDRARSHRLLSRPISGLLALAAFLLVVAAAAFQPVARAGVSDAPILVLRGDKPLSGMKVLAQADSGAKPDAGDAAAAADCARAWKARAKAATNLRVSWTQSETILKGRLPRPQFGLQLPPKDAVIPPVDTTLNGTFKVVLSGGKIRYEEKTDSFSAYTNTQGIQEDVRVCDGRHYTALFTAGNVLTYPIGEVQEHFHAQGVTGERNILPLALFFRIFDPDMGKLAVAKLHFEPGTAVIEGRTCRTIKVVAPNGVTVELSVDPKRDYIPLAYTIGSDGRPGLHLTVTGLRELPSNVWAPTEWHGLIFGDDGNIVSEVEAHVTSFELPKQVDDAQFAIKFPPGTWVVEQEGKRQYVIQANGFERRVPEGFGSSKYSWLMNPANND
jgi:hypothetical protein